MPSNKVYHKPPYNCKKCKDMNWLIECACGFCNDVILLADKGYRERKYKNGHNSYFTPREHKYGPDCRFFKGGRIKRNGYIFLLMPWHPNSIKSGYIREHVYIMSRYLKRPLEKHEIVHHINRQRDDNRIENLQLLQSNKEHRFIHRADRSHYKCENLECKNPTKTYIKKNGSPQWSYIDGKLHCHTCKNRVIYRRTKGKKKLLARPDT